METTNDTAEDRAERFKQRRTLRNAMLGLLLASAAFLTPFLWLGEQQDVQQSQEAIQFQQDCARPSATSPNCQLLPMQVYELKKEGFLDPDAEAHLWLGLQSKSGQKFEVDTDGPQWHRLSVGDQVTALVWNGEVEEVTDSGGSERMKTNPVQQTEDRRVSPTMLKFLALVFLAGLVLVGADKMHEKQRKHASGNAGGG